MNCDLLPFLVVDNVGKHHNGNDKDKNYANHNNLAGIRTVFDHPYDTLPYGNSHLATPPPSMSLSKVSGEEETEWHPNRENLLEKHNSR